MMLFDKVIAYDHLRQKISLIANISTDKLEENYERATGLNSCRAHNQAGALSDRPAKVKPEFTCNISRDEYWPDGGKDQGVHCGR